MTAAEKITLWLAQVRASGQAMVWGRLVIAVAGAVALVVPAVQSWDQMDLVPLVGGPMLLASVVLPDSLAGLVFVLVVVYTLITGPTLPTVAKFLRVARRSEPRGLDIEAAPLERIAADLLQVTISPVSKIHGVEVGELRLPAGSSISIIIRDGETMVPERRTVLKHGDDLLVVTPRRQREKTEERLRQVSARGRLAQWLG